MSCNSRLTDLRIRRDAIEEALGTGKAYVELEIRGRRVRLDATVKMLEYLNSEITKLERTQSGPARNKVRMSRP